MGNRGVKMKTKKELAEEAWKARAAEVDAEAEAAACASTDALPPTDDDLKHGEQK